MKGIITLLISSILCGICGWSAAKEKNVKFLVLAIVIALVNVCIQRI